MKQLSLIFAIFIFISGSLLAQVQDTVWTNTFGGDGDDWIGQSILQTSDGGFIMTGFYTVDSTNIDVLLLKIDAAGQFVWSKTYGGSGEDIGSDIEITADGDIIIAARTDSYGDGEQDWWLIKTDAAGNEIWNRTYGDEGNEFDLSIEITSDGGFILYGSTDSNSDYTGCWLVKTNDSGDIEWEKTFFDTGVHSSHGTSVRQTTDGGYILVGQNDNVGKGIELIKTDSFGNTTWIQEYGGINPSEDEGYDVQQTTDGGYILVGETLSFGPNDTTTYAWLIKTDALGDTLWTKRFFTALPDSIGAAMGYGNSIIITEDGGYIFTGFRGPNLSALDLFLTKTDENGNEESTSIITGAAGMCLSKTDNGDYIVGGITITEDDDFELFFALFESVSTGIINDGWQTSISNQLHPNYPNPFNIKTSISYSIINADIVTLKIYNMIGKEIKTLVNEFQDINNYTVDFDAKELPSGIYNYKIQVGNDYTETKKMILIR